MFVEIQLNYCCCCCCCCWFASPNIFASCSLVSRVEFVVVSFWSIWAVYHVVSYNMSINET